MAGSANGNGKGKGTKANVIVWTGLAVLILVAGILALNVTQRIHRVVQETTQVRSVVQEAVKRQDMIVKAPARKEFSAAFLQMAFGDNPQLLEQIKDSLSKALGENPTLAQGDVAMMLVTYRAEGELRDVAIHIFGNLVPEKLPAFSSEGYWKSQLPDTFFQMGQSMLSTLGREVVILASPEAEKRQRDLLEAILNNRYDTVQNYLREPVSFIAVIPEPGLLFTDRFRPYMAAALIKGKISLDEGRAEMVALSMDPQKARELAQLLSDTRMMGIGIARVRYGSPEAEAALEQLSRAQIVADGPAVKMTGMLPGELIGRGLPRAIRALAKGVGRIQRGPGYPS
ncbi:MAG TPA: hypothetical protein VMV72_11120 [Verrucomicrobiae bacterium]|nr:hypothetical protein [Verrucomicrobiae bacterium]